MIHVIYNLRAGGCHEEDEKSIKTRLKKDFGEEPMYAINLLCVDDKRKYLEKLTAEDKLVLVGGDGTLNHFINEVENKEYDFPIYCYAGGTGNDFIHDVTNGSNDELVQINGYIRSLPKVYVNGQTYKFINGLGYGIDGYCCEEGDKLKAKSDKPVDYTAIAIKGLLFKFKPVKATVTVDGKGYQFNKVWIAPTMNGRCYGGGMFPTPDQDRLGDGQVSFMALYGSGKLKTLMVFPSIFKGEHVKHTEMVTIIKGREVTVEFDRPCALQIDGETVLDVTSYTVKAGR